MVKGNREDLELWLEQAITQPVSEQKASKNTRPRKCITGLGNICNLLHVLISPQSERQSFTLY
jgi:hypothetical protein